MASLSVTQTTRSSRSVPCSRSLSEISIANLEPSPTRQATTSLRRPHSRRNVDTWSATTRARSGSTPLAALGVTGTTGCSAHHNSAKQPPQTSPTGFAAGQQLTSVETVCSRVLLLHPGERKVVAAFNGGCVPVFACASGMAMAAAVPSTSSRAGAVTRPARDRASDTTVLVSGDGLKRTHHGHLLLKAADLHFRCGAMFAHAGSRGRRAARSNCVEARCRSLAETRQSCPRRTTFQRSWRRGWEFLRRLRIPLYILFDKTLAKDSDENRAIRELLNHWPSTDPAPVRVPFAPPDIFFALPEDAVRRVLKSSFDVTFPGWSAIEQEASAAGAASPKRFFFESLDIPKDQDQLLDAILAECPKRNPIGTPLDSSMRELLARATAKSTPALGDTRS
jgi:hypothetical protein